MHGSDHWDAGRESVPVPIVSIPLDQLGSGDETPQPIRCVLGDCGAMPSLLARTVCCVGLGTLSLMMSGCVSRRMMVMSDPPGALVLLEGREIGTTPVSVDFTYYGTRELTLVKDGYETLTVQQKVQAPWYQMPVVEFFADNLTPGHVTDRHQFRYALQPQRLVPNAELQRRAEMLRGEARLGR